MKKVLALIRKIISRNLGLKLLSLGVAILLWLIVVVNINPNYTHTISGVRVTVDENSGLLSNTGLKVIEKSDSNIRIEVSGPRDTIGRLSGSDFVVTPDVSPVTKSGKYSLKLSAVMKRPNPQVKILSITPSAVEVNFDMVISKTLPVRVHLPTKKVADGYILISPTANPQSVVVTGAAAEIDQVTQAVVNAEIDNNAKDTAQSKESVQLLDGSGSPVDTKHIRLDAQTVNVTVPVLKLKQPQPDLQVDFTNIPAGFDPANIQYTIDPPKISVAGKPSMVDPITSVKLQSIDFRTLDIASTVHSDVMLPSGLTNVENLTGATVTVRLLNTSSRIVGTSALQVINTPPNYGVSVRTKRINNIQLFGPTAEINTVVEPTAVIDMSSVPIVEGLYEVPVTIETPGKTGYWAKGNYTATIYLWKKR